MKRHRVESPPEPNEAVRLALEELGGGATIVLDEELRTILVGPRAEALLGEAVPLGVALAKILCGHSIERPVAEALAAGRAISTTVQRPLPGGGVQTVLVRAAPVNDPGANRRAWVVSLEKQQDAEGPELFSGMWSGAPNMKRVFRIIDKVASTNSTVLVRGESGSGKELVAQALHARSQRARGPLRAINCAAVPPALLESELFGHVKGAFTGAVRDNPGHFRLADKGTLFLDEVAELPLELQAKMLRVLETRTIQPVGARDAASVDVRIVAATHRALRKEVEAGRFRADLMYRLRVIPIFLPSLRERGADVLLLAHRFIQEYNEQARRKVTHIAPSAADALLRYEWPGNVRELRNALEYAYAIGDGPVLVMSDLPPEIAGPHAPAVDEPVLSTSSASAAARSVPLTEEATRILRALDRSAGSRARAAKILGMSRVTLWRRMKSLGLVTSLVDG